MAHRHPLRWPMGWPVTPIMKRADGVRFQSRDGRRQPVSFTVAREQLLDELWKLGATHAVTMSNRPGGDADPAPVAVDFMLHKKHMSMGADRFTTAAANMRSLAIAIAALRQLQRHGGGVMLERAASGFAALPAPRTCWDILEITPQASPEQIARAFRTKAATMHPDVGGDHDLMAELNAARDQALELERGQD
jgi:hypothetical protein